MTPDKIAQLRRQRELVKQHLDWLDTELAAHTGDASEQPATQRIESPLDPPVAPESADPTLSNYEPDPQSAGSDAKRGCLILFFAIVVLGALILCGIYFWKYRDRPLLFSSERTSLSFNAHQG